MKYDDSSHCVLVHFAMYCFDITDPDKNFHYVVDCAHNVMREHCYWPLVSDLNNVLSHRPVAVKFMSDDNLLEMWFAFLSMFQGENVALYLLYFLMIQKYGQSRVFLKVYFCSVKYPSSVLLLYETQTSFLHFLHMHVPMIYRVFFSPINLHAVSVVFAKYTLLHLNYYCFVLFCVCAHARMRMCDWPAFPLTNGYSGELVAILASIILAYDFFIYFSKLAVII